MATRKYGATASPVSVITTGMDSLANNGKTAASTTYTNQSTSSNRYMFAEFELVVTFASAPTANKSVDVYFLSAPDGTNFADGGASVDPSETTYGFSFLVRNSASAQRLVARDIRIPATDFKVMVINRSGQAMTSSGHTLKMTPYNEEIV